jgi:hypothetical protein
MPAPDQRFVSPLLATGGPVGEANALALSLFVYYFFGCLPLTVRLDLAAHGPRQQP